MRVTKSSTALLLQRVHRDERGVAALLVAIVIPVLFGAALLAIDAGSVWAMRRSLVTGTDASALGTARNVVVGEPDCDAAPSILDANVTGAELTKCSVVQGDPIGYVETEGTGDVTVIFGGVVGVDDQTIASSSAAQWGPVSWTDNIRPIALCIEEPNVDSWIAAGTGGRPQSAVYRVPWTKDNPLACGSDVPGNWGWIDFNGRGHPTPELVDWLLNSWPNPVGVRDCNGDGDPGDLCHADPGGRVGPMTKALQQLVNNEIQFSVVLYDQGINSGGQATYDVAGFMSVVPRGFNLSGTDSERYLDLEFRRAVIKGGCCASDGIDAGALGIRLCGADHDPAGVTGRCES